MTFSSEKLNDFINVIKDKKMDLNVRHHSIKKGFLLYAHIYYVNLETNNRFCRLSCYYVEPYDKYKDLNKLKAEKKCLEDAVNIAGVLRVRNLEFRIHVNPKGFVNRTISYLEERIKEVEENILEH